MKRIVIESKITCPECNHKEAETMPTESCRWFYECKGCKKVLTPINNDCCVYCSYGTVPCPPIQLEPNSCGSNDCCWKCVLTFLKSNVTLSMIMEKLKRK